MIRSRALPIIVSLLVPLGMPSKAVAAIASTPTTVASQPTMYCGLHITVSYWGALGYQPAAGVDIRSSPVAHAITEKILARALEPGADFVKVGEQAAKEFPDVTFMRTNPFSPGTLAPEVERTIMSLKPDQTADYITTSPYGFHVIHRNATIRCRHIMVAYREAARSLVSRTREEARRRAEQLRAEAMKPGVDFAAIAQANSDAPDAQQGGDVGVFDRGYMVKSFEDAAFALKVGEISPVIETRFGFHIIKRIE